MGELKRAISLPLLTFYGLGTVVGAGIYVLVGKVAGRAGAFAPLAFVVAAIVAALCALSFAELASRLPRAGGEASYIQHAFGRPALSRVMGVIVMLTGIVSAATLVEGFAGYFRELWALPVWGLEIAMVVLMAALATWGISESVWVAAVLTAVEIAGLLLVVGLLVGEPPRSNGLDAIRWVPETAEAWSGIGAAAFLAFYAFIGFEDMVNVAEEVRRPGRAIPIAIALVLLIVTVLYLAVVMVALTHASPERLAAAEAPLTELLRGGAAWAPLAITLVGLVAVTNGALVQLIKTSRVLYGMADQGLLWAPLGRVGRRTQTPVIATLLAAAVVLAFALLLPLTVLAELTSVLILIVFLAVNVALAVLQRREPAPGFSVPRWWPPLAALSCVALLALRIALFA